MKNFRKTLFFLLILVAGLLAVPTATADQMEAGASNQAIGQPETEPAVQEDVGGITVSPCPSSEIIGFQPTDLAQNATLITGATLIPCLIQPGCTSTNCSGGCGPIGSNCRLQCAGGNKCCCIC